MIEAIGRDRINGRDLFLARLAELEAWGDELPGIDAEFVAFVALDATHVSDVELERFASKLLKQRAAYLCAWGPGCERVHDVFDAVRDRDAPAPVTTTWHADDTLDQAVWFALYTACPHDRYIETCAATVCIVVARDDWAEQVRAALADPAALTARVAD